MFKPGQKVVVTRPFMGKVTTTHGTYVKEHPTTKGAFYEVAKADGSGSVKARPAQVRAA